MKDGMFKRYILYDSIYAVSKHAEMSCLKVQPLLVGLLTGMGHMETSGVLVIYPIHPMLYVLSYVCFMYRQCKSIRSGPLQ